MPFFSAICLTMTTVDTYAQDLPQPDQTFAVRAGLWTAMVGFVLIAILALMSSGAADQPVSGGGITLELTAPAFIGSYQKISLETDTGLQTHDISDQALKKLKDMRPGL